MDMVAVIGKVSTQEYVRGRGKGGRMHLQNLECCFFEGRAVVSVAGSGWCIARAVRQHLQTCVPGVVWRGKDTEKESHTRADDGYSRGWRKLSRAGLWVKFFFMVSLVPHGTLGE